MAERLAILVAGSLLVLQLLEVAGRAFAVIEPALPVAGGDAASKIAIAVEAADQAITMLVTLSLGMFAVVGLLVRDAIKRPVSLASLTGPVAFLMLSIVSLYFGFLARMQVLHSANYSAVPIRGVMDLIGWQGTFLALSVLCLLVTIFDVLIAPQLKKTAQ